MTVWARTDMEVFSTTVSALAAVLGIIVLGVAAWVFVSGSYNKARIQALREDNEDLRHRVADTEAELETCKRHGAEREETIGRLEAEKHLLANMITQRAEVEAISDLLEHHHKEALRVWERTAKQLDRLSGRKDGPDDRPSR